MGSPLFAAPLNGTVVGYATKMFNFYSWHLYDYSLAHVKPQPVILPSRGSLAAQSLSKAFERFA
jgi:hypothetical protein